MGFVNLGYTPPEGGGSGGSFTDADRTLLNAISTNLTATKTAVDSTLTEATAAKTEATAAKTNAAAVQTVVDALAANGVQLTPTEKTALADALLGSTVEGTVQMKGALQLLVAGLAGKLSGATSAGVATIKLRNVSDTQDILTIVGDEFGNKQLVVLDLPAE